MRFDGFGVADRPQAYASGVSRLWDQAFRVFYWMLTRLGPVIRPIVTRIQTGNIVELETTGRRSGKRRRVLLGLLRVDAGWYLGHPNGATKWTRNLDGTTDAKLRFVGQAPFTVTADLLADGDERRSVIAVTWRQHVFPGSILYWLARRHIAAVGRYYRIEIAS